MLLTTYSVSKITYIYEDPIMTVSGESAYCVGMKILFGSTASIHMSSIEAHMGMERQIIPGAWWPAILVEVVRSWFSKRLCLKK